MHQWWWYKMCFARFYTDSSISKLLDRLKRHNDDNIKLLQSTGFSFASFPLICMLLSLPAFNTFHPFTSLARLVFFFCIKFIRVQGNSVVGKPYFVVCRLMKTSKWVALLLHGLKLVSPTLIEFHSRKLSFINFGFSRVSMQSWIGSCEQLYKMQIYWNQTRITNLITFLFKFVAELPFCL